MQLYEYAIIYDPKDTKGKNPAKAKVLAFDKILANDQNEAQIVAARKIPEDYVSKLSEVQIAVRPF